MMQEWCLGKIENENDVTREDAVDALRECQLEGVASGCVPSFSCVSLISWFVAVSSALRASLSMFDSVD